MRNQQLLEAVARLERFFQGEVGEFIDNKCLVEVKQAWEHLKPELPDADSIAVRWHILDVGQALEEHFSVPADTLTDEQKREVLQDVQEDMDANNGVNWDAIISAIESLFSDVVEEAQAKEEEP